MSNSCKLIPNASNGKQSKLYQDIAARVKDRDSAKKIWAFTKTKLFTQEFTDLPVDENGEVTFQALDNVLGLSKLFTDKAKDNSLALDLGITTPVGTPATFTDPSLALSKANEYNEKAKDSIADVENMGDGTYKTEVKARDAISLAHADRNNARANLNKRLISILNSIGFDVTVDDNLNHPGIFDPTRAEWNADMLKTAIAVTRSEEGMDALPEEFSHLVLAGLKNHQLKLRADSMFTDDVVRAVLGDQYNRYHKLYSRGTMPVDELLRDEAEGKVLASLLKGESLNTAVKNRPAIIRVFERIWDFVRRLFGKISVSTIDNAIADAQNSMSALQSLIMDEDLEPIIDAELIKNHDKMYDLNEQTEKMLEIVDKGDEILSKRLDILQHTDANEEDIVNLNKNINKIRDDIEKQRYYSACSRILATIGNEVIDLGQKTSQMSHINSGSTDLNVIHSEAEVVRAINSVITGYMPYLNTLRTLPKLVSKGEINMDSDAADRIAHLAEMYVEQLEDMAKEMKQLRFAVLKQLITLYHGNMGEAPETFQNSEKYKWESVDTILQYANEDIGWADTRVFSAGDSRNPLINVIHKIVVSQQAKRNNMINKACARMQEADKKLREAGQSNDFVYQLDAEGVPTGYYVGPRDIAKFEREHDEFLENLKAQNLEPYEYMQKKTEWENERVELVEVGEPLPDGTRRTEVMPKMYDDNGNILYAVPNFQEGWTNAQKEYYKALLDMKAEMDQYLPEPMQGLYNAPQVRKSVTQMFDKGGKEALKTLWGNWKKKVSVTVDNTDYANAGTTLDFNNKEIKRIPIYFVQKLDNQKDLSTDATHAMFNFITMAVNYGEMNKLAAAMSLMQDYVTDTTEQGYDVRQTDAGKPVIDSFFAAGRTYWRQLVKRGEGTNTSNAIVKYIDRQFFGKTKEKLGNADLGFMTVSKDAVANTILRITSVSRIGFNVLSGITNVTQGETQMIEEANTKRYFDFKDYKWAKGEYGKLLTGYLGNFNSADRHDKMYMLINQFNSSEDFFRDMRDKDFNKSAAKRILGRGNVYFLNTMGEHYLHTAGMLMVLKHEKVKRLNDPSGKEVSLYDVIKQVHDENGWHLELDDDIQFVDTKKAFLQGNGLTNGTVTKADRDKLFESLAIYINNINAGMHGGYSEAEKGNINQSVLLQFVNQFRQWMWGMYNKLYSRPYYDAVMGVQKEGAYYSLYKFAIGLIHDLKNMSIKEAFNKNQLDLTPEAKRGLRVAYAQGATMAILWIVCSMTKGWKDDDDRAQRLLAYSAQRLNLETGALFPYPPSFLKNVFTLVQSPAAGVNTLEDMADILNLTNYLKEINSGRFKGWNRGLKNLYVLTPIYNIQKLIDMRDYSYMFNIFK